MSQQINLFNPIFLKQEKYFSAVTMSIALAAIAIACGALIGYSSYSLSKVSREAEANQTNIKVSQHQIQKLDTDSKARVKSAEVESALRGTQAELEALQQVKEVLDRGDFSSAQGFSEYFRAFARQTIDGLWLTGFILNSSGSELSIQGRALAPELIPIYVGRLRQEQALVGKSFAAIDVRVGDPKKVVAEASRYLEFALRSDPPGADAASAPASAPVPAPAAAAAAAEKPQ